MRLYGAVADGATRRGEGLASAGHLHKFLPALIALSVIAIVFVAVSTSPTESELLVRASEEQIQEARALQQEDLQQARGDETRANELASLITTASTDLTQDERVANTFAIKAQQMAAQVANLRQKLDTSSTAALSSTEARLSGDEEQDAAQQNALLQQEANVKRQEQQLLMSESEQSNLAAGSEQQGHLAKVAEAKDEQLMTSQKAAIARDQAAINLLFKKEKPAMMAVQLEQNKVNAARTAMQAAMSKVDQYKEDAQAAVIQAQMDARSARRQRRDNAERALNRAVAKEQQLQSGPNHERLKLTGAKAKQLVQAQLQVKKAQAALAAAYSDISSPTSPPPSAVQSAALTKAENEEDAATSAVETLMSQLNKAKNRLARMQMQIENDQNREMSNERLLAMISNRAQSEESDIALVAGRAAAARQQAAQDQKQVQALEATAAGVQKRIAFFNTKRSSDLGQLTAQEMNKKKIAAKAEVVASQVSAAAAQLSIDRANAAKAYAKVSQQAKQIAALKAEEQADRANAAHFLANANAQGRAGVTALDNSAPSTSDPGTPPAPYPTNQIPAAQ